MKKKTAIIAGVATVASVLIAVLVWNHFYGNTDAPVWERVRMGEHNATRVEPPRSERIPEDMLTFSLNRTERLQEQPAAKPYVRPDFAKPVAPSNGSVVQSEPVQDDVPKEDSVVTWAFCDSLAALVADGYYPKGSHPQASKKGALILGMKKLNMHYGSRMTGLRVRTDNPVAARKLIFEYAMPKAAMRFLYELYAQRLVDNIDVRARELARDTGSGDAPLTGAQVAELFSLASDKVGGLAAVLAVCGRMDDLEVRVAAYHDAVEATLDANETFVGRLQMYEELREAPDATEDYREQVRAGMEAAGQAYQQAIRHREKTRAALAAAVRPKSAARSISEDEGVYVARWAARRLNADPVYRESLVEGADLLQDLSTRLLERSRQ